ncbi:MAG: pyridoxamine 5'-phosphate oxidase [Gemmatimonadota bacterium]
MAEKSTDSAAEPLTGSGGETLDTRGGTDPIELFAGWFEAARAAGIELPEAVALATATPDGVPSVRMVLLKGFDDRGFTFFTNYESRKAGELDANPHAALCFHWKELDRQVRVTGEVRRVSEEESREYFVSRPKGSRLGAWASKQSRPLASRTELEGAVEAVRRRFPGGDVPLPPFWGGYRVLPERIEFWQGRSDRLHDRIAFDRTDDRWNAVRLYP